jgi:hypothetical protein
VSIRIKKAQKAIYTFENARIMAPPCRGHSLTALKCENSGERLL